MVGVVMDRHPRAVRPRDVTERDRLQGSLRLLVVGALDAQREPRARAHQDAVGPHLDVEAIDLAGRERLRPVCA